MGGLSVFVFCTESRTVTLKSRKILQLTLIGIEIRYLGLATKALELSDFLLLLSHSKTPFVPLQLGVAEVIELYCV